MSGDDVVANVANVANVAKRLVNQLRGVTGRGRSPRHGDAEKQIFLNSALFYVKRMSHRRRFFD